MIHNLACTSAILVATLSCASGMEIHSDFTDPNHGWAYGFSDFSSDPADFASYEFEAGYTLLPKELGSEGKNGVVLQSHNRSDDVLMFINRAVSGLVAGGEYEVSFSVIMATNEASGCRGIGGAPGESVFVKAGTTAMRPEVELQGDDYRINVDIGQQGNPGKHAVVLGNVANSSLDCIKKRYEIKVLESEKKIAVKADGTGTIWLFAGTDSGYEGLSRLFFLSFSAEVAKVQ